MQLVREALGGILQRPARAMLTAFGTVLGVGTLVAIAGLTSSANSRITERFNELSATEVKVLQSNEDDLGPDPFPQGSDAAALKVEGVESAGTYTLFSSLDVSYTSGISPPQPLQDMGVLAVSTGYWESIRPEVQGRTFDESLAKRPVAVVGRAVFRRLGGETFDDTQRSLTINGVKFAVIGVLQKSDRMPEATLAVMIPREVADSYWGGGVGSVQARGMIVQTRLGAASVVAQQLALALRPDRPDLLEVEAPVEPTRLRDSVSEELQALFIGTAGVLLLVAMSGIANATYISVLERVPEIGLRRAVGASPRHIATQFLLEAGLIGFIGGVVGGLVGLCAALAACAVQDWTAVIPSWVYWVGPAIGAVTGLLAGLVPALKASRVEPVEAFRR